MNKHEKINYIELPSQDLKATKSFFKEVFDWSFVDYGDEYIAFSNQGIEGGFFQSNVNASTDNGSVLVVFYSQTLLETQSKIKDAGGEIIKEIYSFPGGHRFHFCDLTGNEYAVWSDSYAM